jgi:hypothetical protein
MSHPKWLEKYLRMKPEVANIYDDLDAYKEFCIKQGYVFDEAHLYHEKTPWGEFQRVLAGKYPKDNWSPHPKPERTNFRPRDNNYRSNRY